MAMLTSGGFVSVDECYCHYCGDRKPFKGFACYGCSKCHEFYTACKDTVDCAGGRLPCLKCQGNQGVKPFDLEFHNKIAKDQGFGN